jgi:elongation factor G
MTDRKDKEKKFLIRQRVEPKTRLDHERLLAALLTIEGADPLFRVSVDPESGEVILKGQSEPHLDNIVDRLIREFNVGVVAGAQQVAYLETLARAADIDYTHKKIFGPTCQFARVKLRLEPLPRDSGNVFESEFVDDPAINKFSAAVRKGVTSVWENGILIGFPMVDTNVTWYDGAFHETDSSPVAFEIATRAAMKEACDKGGVNILEPIMEVVVTTPTEFTGGILRNLDGRRSAILNQRNEGGETAIHAHVPLANMFGYISELARLTNNRADHWMSFSHYQELPRNISGDDPDKFPPAVGMRA